MKKIYKTPVVRSCIINVKDVLLSYSKFDPMPFSLDKETNADPSVECDSRTGGYNVWDDEW